MPLTTYLAADEASFHQKAAQLILESAASAVDQRGRFSIALSGGSTPRRLYSLLAETYFRDRMSWDHWHVFWGDERCVPPDHADSNYKMARDTFLSKVPVPASQVHRIQGETPANDAARAYERDLRAHFRNEAKPRFDLILLGVGDDGHTASLFPGTSALKESEHWATGLHVPQLGTDRVTLTFPILNAARRIVVICAGESKSSVVRDVFQTDGPVRYPIQRIKPDDGEQIWILDKPAASKLPPETRFQAIHL